jgi:hypothetical protein
VRENRTHGSEGGDGESRFRPLSDFRKVRILRSKLRKFTFSFDAPDAPSRIGGELTLVLDRRDF